MNTNWGCAAAAYHEGEIDFAEFAGRTERQRKRWVGRLRERLQPIPVWHSQEDSDQDFLTTLFVRGQRYDPAFSKPGGYFHFGLKSVSKVVQKARGVEQHRRTGSPMFERTFSAAGFAGPPEVPDPSKESDVERAILRKQYYEILRGLCLTTKQLAVVCALQAGGGSLAGATAHLYSDLDLRRDLRLLSEEHATSTVNRVVRELIATYGKKEEGAQ